MGQRRRRLHRRPPGGANPLPLLLRLTSLGLTQSRRRSDRRQQDRRGLRASPSGCTA
jgi:hypothetical protein